MEDQSTYDLRKNPKPSTKLLESMEVQSQLQSDEEWDASFRTNDVQPTQTQEEHDHTEEITLSSPSSVSGGEEGESEREEEDGMKSDKRGVISGIVEEKRAEKGNDMNMERLIQIILEGRQEMKEGQQKMEKMEQSLKQEMKEGFKEIKEMKEGQEEMKEGQEEMKEGQQKLEQSLKREIKEMKEGQQEMKEGLKGLEFGQQKLEGAIEKVKEELREEREQMRREMEEQTDNKIKQVRRDFQVENNDIRKQTQKLQEDTNKQIEDLRSDMTQQATSQEERLKNDLRADTKQIIALECSTYHKEINLKIEDHQKSIEEQQQRIENLQEDVVKSTISQSNKPTAIYVTCNGGSLSGESQVPRFNGKTANPTGYLRKLKQYFLRIQALNHNLAKREEEVLMEVIDGSFEYMAHNWWQLVQDSIHSWNDFEREFISRYWNKDIQRHVKNKLETEYYRENGKLTRSEYFIERVITMKSLDPTPTEEEIVDRLSEHFNDIIQDSKRVQNINNIKDFNLLLQREDMKRGQQQSKYSPRTSRRFEKGNRVEEQQRRPTQPTQYPTRYEKQTPEYTHRTAYIPRRGPGEEQGPRREVTNQPYRPRGYEENNGQRSFERNKQTQSPIQKPFYNQTYTNSNGNYRSEGYNSNGVPYQNNRNLNAYPTREQKNVCQIIAENPNINTPYRNNPDPDQTRGSAGESLN